MTQSQKNEIRAILTSLQEDLANAEESSELKASAVEAALVCLLDALANL